MTSGGPVRVCCGPLSLSSSHPAATRSPLHPRQSGDLPPTERCAVTARVLVPFEPLEDVEGAGVTEFLCDRRGVMRAAAAAADEQHRLALVRDLLDQLPLERGVSRSARPGIPLDEHRVVHAADPFPLGPGPDADAPRRRLLLRPLYCL